MALVSSSCHTYLPIWHALEHQLTIYEGEAHVFWMFQLVKLHCLQQGVILRTLKIHSLPLQPCNTHKTWQRHFFTPIMFPTFLQVIQILYFC